MATFKFKRILYSSKNEMESNITPEVEELDDKSEVDTIDSVKSPSESSKVETKDIMDRIKNKPNNIILPSKLEKSKTNSPSNKSQTGLRTTQNKNIGIRINKTTTVNNPSNEKVQQARLIQQSQQAAQESGKPDPDLIPKAPEPKKPVGLFKR